MSRKLIQKIYLEELGTIRFEQSKRAKRLILRVEKKNETIVVMPLGISLSKGRAFLETQKEWLINTYKKMSAKNSFPDIWNEETKLKLGTRKLIIERADIQRVSGNSNTEEYRILVPKNYDINNAETQIAIKWVTSELLRHSAKIELGERLRFFSEKHKISFNKLTIKKMRTRWGSCSSKGNINLSLHLLVLPKHLQDYVILHELTHRTELGHGKSFWLKLDKLTDGHARSLDNELSKKQLILF